MSKLMGDCDALVTFLEDMVIRVIIIGTNLSRLAEQETCYTAFALPT